MQQDGVEPPRPPVAFSHLFECLFEVGPTTFAGMGSAPLTWQEIDAWARRVPRGLQPGEFVMLRRLSMEWLAQSEAAKEEGCPPPWGYVSAEQKRAAAMRLRESMRAMTRGGGK